MGYCCKTLIKGTHTNYQLCSLSQTPQVTILRLTGSDHKKRSTVFKVGVIMKTSKNIFKIYCLYHKLVYICIKMFYGKQGIYPVRKLSFNC